ncbi:6-pyruvoyl-tetrahydropterin synthase-related protein [Pannus brasiliensis CCIBt3594]|uniref:6-pyruvoyl-tetrahydropterin synthase-related protein n=1 Tax=Pannus brasiliensis CCIBt3594 TaxID=1427578 RepID=A0AAW9QYE8_9CHRO
MSTDTSPLQTPLARLRSISPKAWEIGAVIVILLMALVINARMLRYGLTGLGDLRWHITWIQHFSHQIAEGILYPRWLAGTNFGYGSPTFVFYPPLVYYIGSVFQLLGFGIEGTMSAVFTLAVVLSGLSFYVYGRSKWNRAAALGGALFYMTTPYLFGILGGGALASLFGFAWIPIGVWTIDRAIDRPRWRVGLAFLWMLVALTHTPSLLIYAIAGGLYTLIAGWRKSPRTAIETLVFMALGLAMAGFYLLPAVLEQRFTSVEYIIDFSPYYLHFFELLRENFREPFFRELSIFATLAAIALFLNREKPDRKWQVIGALVAMGVTLFLLSDWSSWIWQASSLLRKLERPPRIIVILYFAAAALYTMAIDALLQKRRAWKFFVLTLIALTILFNLRVGLQSLATAPALHSPTQGKVFIREWLEIMLRDPFSDKLVDVPEYRPPIPPRGDYPPFTRERYSDSGIPLTSAEDRARIPLPVPEIGQPRVSLIDGRARFEIEKWDSYFRRLKVEATTPATLRVRLFYYPAWRLSVNGQSRPLEKADDGTVLVKVEPGTSTVELSYGLTDALIAGIAIAFGSLSIVLGYGFFLWKKTRSVRLDRVR